MCKIEKLFLVPEKIFFQMANFFDFRHTIMRVVNCDYYTLRFIMLFLRRSSVNSIRPISGTEIHRH
jgi:hypothetical protein